ncbi:ser thr protein phosphatase family protein [Stylonychia lemnae]|uniref:Ser thr protein phosphatase family protein n=1 Tax=Stylonychia lemnae TaxID=5949 RepID=A0A078AYD1_STYLE|nr:ser thr protein phosphatase family protein [Stylonychia lemnae]|eukprot:CDW86227.1 ser thr protein phosphatase family protein [Stylonychia lemnae]
MAGTVNTTFNNEMFLKWVKILGAAGCGHFTNYDVYSCRGIIEYFSKSVVDQLFKYPLSPAYICMSEFLPFCKFKELAPLSGTKYQYKMLQDKPEIIKNDDYLNNLYDKVNGNKKRPTIKFVQLTDLHIDLDYVAGSNAKCGSMLCCRAMFGFPKDPSKQAKKLGSFGCDSPKELLYSLGQFIRSEIKPDAILWTGDSTTHAESYNMTFEQKVDELTFLNDYIKTNLSDYPVFAAIGNHDFGNSHQQDFNNGDQTLDLLADQWSIWLEDQAKEQFQKTGYYAQKLKLKSGKIYNNSNVIMLNTEACYNVNFYIWSYRNDPGNQLEWLNRTLHEYEENNQIAIVIAHIPPSYHECNHGWSVRIKSIFDRFQHIIRFQTYGHEHYEMHNIVRSVMDSKPVGVQFWSASLTPMDLNFPSVRVFELDEEHLIPIRAHTYFLNINEDQPQWLKHHEMTQLYEMDDLSPKSFDILSEKIKEEEYMALKYQSTKFIDALPDQSLAWTKRMKMNLYSNFSTLTFV